MKTLTNTLLSAVLLATVLPATARAHEFQTHQGQPITWLQGYLHLYIDSDFGPLERGDIQQAANRWNDAPSDFSFITHECCVAESSPLDNGQSEVWWTVPSYWMAGLPARTYGFSSGPWWLEQDILINIAYDDEFSYTDTKSQVNAYHGPRIHFQNLMIHELGHVMGLDDEGDTYNVMGNHYTHLNANGSLVRAYPGEDASDGAVDLYGQDPDMPEDVGVSHWRWYGEVGDHSQHRKTYVYNSDGYVAKMVGVDGEWGYEVRAGETVQVEFSFENNGSTKQRPRVRYYGSTNDYISQYDTLFASAKVTLNRNTVYTRRQTVTVPSHLVKGQEYFLGAIVDWDDAIDETMENNNATYIGVRIVN